jgi:hypothetical protein
MDSITVRTHIQYSASYLDMCYCLAMPRRATPRQEPAEISLKPETRAVHVARAVRLNLTGPALFRQRIDGQVERTPFVEIRTTNVWYEVPLSEEWRAALRLVEQAGALRIGELRIFPADADRAPGAIGEWSAEALGYRARVPDGGLPANLVHGLRLGAHFTEAQRVLATSAVRNPHVADLWKRLGLTADRLTTAPQRADAVLRRYARAADVYVQAIKRDVPPLPAVARALKVEYAMARDIIHQARQRDILLPKRGTRGKAEGYLSPRAIQILESKKGARR